MSGWYSDDPNDYFTREDDDADLIKPRQGKQVRLGWEAPDPYPWMDQAECRDVDPDLFFADNPLTSTMAVCKRCPVMHECRVFMQGVAYGYGGGQSMTERARVPA